MEWLSELEVDFVPLSDEVVLRRPLIGKSRRYNATFEVPAGFMSDMASIPAFAWPIIGSPFDHRWREESVLHDYFYRNKRAPVTRNMADLIFFDGLRAKRLPWWKSGLMFLAVRIFGADAWSNNDDS